MNDSVRRWHRLVCSVTMVAAALPLACGKPTLVGGAGAPGAPGAGMPGASGGSSPGTPGAPSFALPDAAPPAPGGNDAGPPASPGMACASESHEAQQVPLDLVFLVDTSGSMYELTGGAQPGGQPAPQTKWLLTQNGLRAFMGDPKSTGLGVGLQFFPLKGDDRTCTTSDECGNALVGENLCVPKNVCTTNGQPVHMNKACDPLATPGSNICPFGGECTPLGRCTGNGAVCYRMGQPCPGGGGMCGARPNYCKNIGAGSCTLADYETLAVPIGELPAVQAAIAGAIDRKEPIGHTPTVPAVEGTLNHLRQHLAANPGRKGALVLITDGLPLGCEIPPGGEVNAVARLITAAASGPAPIATYVIGVFPPGNVAGPIAVNRWAMAGGTGTAIVLTPAEDLTQRFLDTLNQIRGRALPCEFMIPTPMAAIDFGRVNVRVQGGAGGAQELLYVQRADRCDATSGGWYYDIDPATGTPRRVLLCPASCTRIKADAAARLDLLFGCATRVIQ
jgi:hypothetical protein